jgi:hypothetical protein
MNLARLVLTTALLACLAPAGHAAELSCAQAAASAEAALAIPSGLLLSIGLVESGRADLAGRRSPWPWTVQAAGAGRFFANAQQAAAAVQDLRAGGVQSIDIGCFQMNLFHHPDAFPDMASGFDPLTNATAAAQFLAALRGELGSWEQAVAAYHSRTASLGSPYRDQVYAAWKQPPDTGIVVVHVWGPTGNLVASNPSPRLPRIIVPSHPNG